MQVEVSVQDCYSPSLRDEAKSQNEAEILVDPETWEVWFRHWLELLNPKDEEDAPLQAQESYELSLRLTSDREMQSLNHQYRHKDQPTDVLAFAALEVDYPQLEELEDPLYLGDIVISIETATRQANQQEHPLQTELAWLAAHGLLHLLGWDHPDDASLSRMWDQQQSLLAAVGLRAPTA